MPDEIAQWTALLLLGGIAFVAIGYAVASIVADVQPDWWVITRGTVRGYATRLRRTVTRHG